MNIQKNGGLKIVISGGEGGYLERDGVRVVPVPFLSKRVARGVLDVGNELGLLGRSGVTLEDAIAAVEDSDLPEFERPVVASAAEDQDDVETAPVGEQGGSYDPADEFARFLGDIFPGASVIRFR